MLVLGFLVRQCLKILVCLNDNLVHLLGYGQHFLDIVYNPVVRSTLLGILKRWGRVYIYIVQLNILYGVVVYKSLSHPHHRHKRRVVHVNIPVLRIDTDAILPLC